MRLVSTPESVARGEVSLLAIIETLAAISLAFYLSVHFNPLKWLSVAICISPLLLLRTNLSTRFGTRLYERLGTRMFNLSEPRPVFSKSVAATVVVTFLLPLPIRVWAAIKTFLRYSADAVAAMPGNWARITLSVDSRLAPELLPGSAFSFEALKRELLENQRSTASYLVAAIVLPAFLPALIYRWSLKATAIIYAPLVFVVHSTFKGIENVRTKLALIARDDVTRIAAGWGAVLIVAFTLKLVLMMHLPGFADWWGSHPVSRFVALYVAPSEIPKWQIVSVMNSALAVALVLFARRGTLRYELNCPWPEMPVQRLLGFVSSFRWVLSLYTIACTVYITWNAAKGWHWPALGEKWLPWL